MAPAEGKQTCNVRAREPKRDCTQRRALGFWVILEGEISVMGTTWGLQPYIREQLSHGQRLPNPRVGVRT